ncbi:MAG: acetate uptake transporter, partial [Candidatus Firestonebacteria bacterium]
SMILAMGIFYGGIAQIIAGCMEWKKGNTFATTAFISYGSFWLTLAGLIVMPKIIPGILGPVSDKAFTAYLCMWGLFTFVLFIGTLKINRALQIVFSSLVILYGLLAYANFTGDKSVLTLAGYEGIFCGLSAIYAGLAQVLNEVYGKVVWPLGVVKK